MYIMLTKRNSKCIYNNVYHMDTSSNIMNMVTNIMITF